MTEDNHNSEDLRINLAWIGIGTFVLTFIVQTVVVTWWAAQLTTNQANLGSRIGDIAEAVQKISEEHQKRTELVYNVRDLNARVTRIENLPFTMAEKKSQ